MTTYTIERVSKPEEFTKDFKKFLLEEVPKISETFDNAFDHNNCSPFYMATKMIVLVCRRDGEVRGFLVCSLSNHPFDIKIKILHQLIFYVKPDSGRTAYHLFNKFIDIGKTHANHIITMLTKHTNIKPTTLEKLGFKELETLYRMEI